MRAVGPEAVVEEAEEVLSKLAAVVAAVGVGQVLEQHRGKVVGYRPVQKVLEAWVAQWVHWGR